MDFDYVDSSILHHFLQTTLVNNKLYLLFTSVAIGQNLMWYFCIGKCAGKTLLLILRSVGVLSVVILFVNVGGVVR
jgi:hypothetical protein